MCDKYKARTDISVIPRPIQEIGKIQLIRVNSDHK